MRHTLVILFLLTAASIFAQNTILLKNRGRFPSGSELNQSSGLAIRPDTTYWTHNDQGMPNSKLYRIKETVAQDPILILDTIDVTVPNLDWEDLARNGYDKLYLCDIGKNCNANSPPDCPTRFVFKIYEFEYSDLDNAPEPLTPITYYFKYELVDGCSPTDTVFANTEAAIYHDGAIYLCTKDIWSKPTNNCGSFDPSSTHRFKVTLAPGSTEQSPLIAEYLDALDVEVIDGEEYGHRKILSGSMSPDKQVVALSSSRRLWLLSGFSNDNWFGGTVQYFDYIDSNGSAISRGYEGLEFIDNNNILLSVDGNAGRVSEVDISGLVPSGNVGIGVSDPLVPLHLKNGDVYIDQPGAGVILRSPDGSCFRIVVNDIGTLSAESVECPN